MSSPETSAVLLRVFMCYILLLSQSPRSHAIRSRWGLKNAIGPSGFAATVDFYMTAAAKTRDGWMRPSPNVGVVVVNYKWWALAFIDEQ